MDGLSVGTIVGLVGLVVVSAFFMAAEFALVAFRHVPHEEGGEDGPSPAVSRAIGSLHRPVSGARLGLTLSVLALGWIGVASFAPLVHRGLDAAGVPLPSGVGSFVGVVVALLAVAIVYLVLGDLIPRAVALERARRVASWVAVPLNAFDVLASPLLWLLNTVAEPILNRPGGDMPRGFGQVHGPAEIEALLRLSRAEGVVEEDEEEMIHGVFELTRTVAREVMTPRLDIVAFPETASLDEVLDKAAESGYSRFPVYRESIDDVTGVVLIKDLLGWMREGDDGEAFSLRTVMREPFFVPDSKPVDDLLAEFRSQKLHIALVVDEFGGTDGVVTLEDLVEEIVGDIFDEHDVAEEEVVMLSRDRARVDGGADLADLLEQFGLGGVEDVEEYDTVAGYVIGRLGRIPDVGETVELSGAVLEVVETTEQRVTSLELRLGASGTDGATDGATGGDTEESRGD